MSVCLSRFDERLVTCKRNSELSLRERERERNASPHSHNKTVQGEFGLPSSYKIIITHSLWIIVVTRNFPDEGRVPLPTPNTTTTNHSLGYVPYLNV